MVWSRRRLSAAWCAGFAAILAAGCDRPAAPRAETDSAASSPPAASAPAAEATPAAAADAPVDAGSGEAAAGSPTSAAATADASAATDKAAWIELVSATGGYKVRFTTRPAPIPLNELFELTVEVVTADGAAADAETELVVDAAMPEHEHGMNTQPKVERQPGGAFLVRGMMFHMSGYWEMYFDVTRAGVTERAQYEITIE